MANEWIELVKEAHRHGGPQAMRQAYSSAGKASAGNSIMLVAAIGAAGAAVMGFLWIRDTIRGIPDPVTADENSGDEEPSTF
ncbi:hypothetical protein ASF76_00280 [Microbacterium sp. Leaf151]|nr:hypothetical protein ASF76_00280 [Microbacterium sp. Leaf151]